MDVKPKLPGTSSTEVHQAPTPPDRATPDMPPLSSDDDDDDYDDGDDVSDEDFVPPAKTPRSSSDSSRPHAPAPSRSQRVKQRRYLSPSKQATSGHGDDVKERWCNPDEPDVKPPLPDFQPKHPPGPRINMAGEWSPLSLFRLFFSARAIHSIINNTNNHAAKRKASGMRFKWSEFTVQNFYIFLAVILYSGMVHVQLRADMWRREWPYNFSFPRSCMSRDTFESIFWSLHLCDVKDDEENQKKKGTPKYDRLLKIKPLYNQIVTACNSHFQPCKEISIDERIVANKARTGFKHSMIDKPTKYGYKLFVLSDSSSAYTWNFFVDPGTNPCVQEEGLRSASVMDLMKFKLLGKGYHLYVDNFYTSPELFKLLAANSTAACGTICQSNVGFPKTTQNDLPKRAERGDMRWLRRDNLLFVKWRDTKEVAVCSNFHKAYSGNYTTRKTKEGRQWISKTIPIPDAVRDYKKYISGVDLSDSLIRYSTVRGKTMRWYKTFFYHFVDIAVVNSYILFKHWVTHRGETPMTHKRFREILMKEMVDEAKALVAAVAPRPTLKTTCIPMYFGQTASDQRRVCVVCKQQGRKVKTPVYCSKCDVALCLNSSRNCFKDYHIVP